MSHAYVRLVDFGKPVKLAGVEILPGDLLHADRHGVCIIPLAIAPKLAEACREVERMEKPLLEICRSESVRHSRNTSSWRTEAKVEDPGVSGAQSSDHASRLRDHRLEAMASENSLVGAKLIEPLAFGVPAALAELEEGGGVLGMGFAQFVERG